MTTRPSRLPVAALIWGVAVPVFLWAGFCAGVVLFVPPYVKLFAEFGMRLTAGTEFAFAVADWVATYWYVLPLSLPFLVPLGVLIVLGLWRSGRPGLARLWCGLMVALPVVAALLVAMAIYLSWVKLQEGLSK